MAGEHEGQATARPAPREPVGEGERAELLGCIELHRAGRLAEAENAYRSFLERHPDRFDALRLLGAALLALGRPSEAEPLLGRALRLSPAMAEVWMHRGQALMRLERPDEAAACFEQAAALAPESPRHWSQLGHARLAQRQAVQALECFDRALGLDARSAGAWSDRGSALLGLGRMPEALQAQRRANSLDPQSAAILCNLGLAQMRSRCFEDSLRSYRQAAEIAPDSAAAWRGVSAALTALGRPREALETCERALECTAPGAPGAQTSGSDPRTQLILNRGLLRLTLGDLAAGWQDFEQRPGTRYVTAAAASARYGPWQPGVPIDGRTLLLTHEQGLGDTLQFCRFAPLLSRLGARVLLQAPRSLRELLTSLEGVEAILDPDDADGLPAIDYQCPLPGLPLRLGLTLENLPNCEPYLFASPEKARRWRERLGRSSRPRIGLAWSGNPAYENDAARSIPLSLLGPWLDPSFEWHALQKDISPADETLLERYGICRHDSALADFSDTAALASAMDLVVSVDTSVAHLAGALGLALFVLLPFVPDWRWQLGREDSPWYPSARLFRQERIDDWPGTLARVNDALGARLR